MMNAIQTYYRQMREAETTYEAALADYFGTQEVTRRRQQGTDGYTPELLVLRQRFMSAESLYLNERAKG